MENSSNVNLYSREEFLNEGTFEFEHWSDSHLNSFFTDVIRKSIYKAIIDVLKDEFLTEIRGKYIIVRKNKAGFDDLFGVDNSESFKIFFRCIYVSSGNLFIQILDNLHSRNISTGIEEEIKEISVVTNIEEYNKFKEEIVTFFKNTRVRKGYSSNIKSYLKDHPFQLSIDGEKVKEVANLVKKQLEDLLEEE